MKTFALLLAAAAALLAQGNKIRVIAFGAHPDDCDIRAAGTAALFAQLGHAVKFVSVTNGDAGHQSMAAPRWPSAARGSQGIRAAAGHRIRSAQQSRWRAAAHARRAQADHPPDPAWNADIVLAPRPNDYHPDHRYTGVLVQDAAYMVVVPDVTPEVPALRKNPVFLYYEDNFQRPNPFRPDIAVAIDDVVDKKIDALDSHVSQFYEWLPWVDGKLSDVPKDPVERKAWLKRTRNRPPNPAVREALVKWYGPEKETPRNFTKPSKSANTAPARTKPASANCSPCCGDAHSNLAGRRTPGCLYIVRAR